MSYHEDRDTSLIHFFNPDAQMSHYSGLNYNH
jgi:hypothetical protein